MGEYVPHLVPGLRLRDDVKPLEVTPARGRRRSRSTATSCAGRSGRCGSASTTARGWSCTRSATRTAALRPIAHRLSFAEMVVPYRDPTTDHYRRTAFDIGEWGLGFMTTSLELGCDCLGEIAYLRRRAARHARRAVHDPQRDLHPRGGRRDPVEARRRADRRRGAALAPAGRLLPRDRRQLRVPRLLALLPGRQHRVRGARDRDHGHDAASPRASSRRTARWSTSAPTRRSTSTSSSPGSTSTSTARPTRSTMTESEALPIGPDNPHGLALVQRSTPLRTEQRGHPGLRLAHPARLEGRQRAARATGSARRSATSSCPAARSRRMLDPDSPVLRRAQVIGHTLWVTPVRPRTSAGRAASSSCRASRTAGCRSGPRRTARSRTRTSCSGTCSASTTSRGPRSGRSWRSTSSRSG